MPWFCTIIFLFLLKGFYPSKASIIPEQRVAKLEFELGKRCTYSYQVAVHTARGSQSTESQGHEIHTLVDVTPVDQEAYDTQLHTLHLNVYQPRMRRVRGERVLVNHPVNEELERQLSKPFYFRQYGHGPVLDAFFPKYDDPKVIALKKGIAGAFQVHLKSLGHKTQANIEEHDDSGVYLSKYSTLYSNSSHVSIKREWTNRDYLLLADGTPAKGEHKVQSKHTATVHVRHGQIHHVHREHKGVFESPKGNPRAENKPEFQENEQDIQVLTSGYNKLSLISCEDNPKSSHARSRRETINGNKHKQEIQGLYRDDLVFKDTHKINWKNVGGDKITFRPFYDLMRCFTDPTVKDREIGDCAREIHKLAKHDSQVFQKICNLVLQRGHQNVTSWSVLVSVLAGQGNQKSQDVLARALMSEYPRKLTLDEYESLLEGIFYLPKGPLHKKLFDALFEHAKRDKNHGHQSPMAMLVLSGLVNRVETAGYNVSLSDIVVQLIHNSYNNKSNIYDPDSVQHETFLRNHIWAFGNLGHFSGLSTMLQHANHDSSGIRSAVVSGMRKLPAKHTHRFLLKTLYDDEQNDVKAAVIEVYIERHQDLSSDIVQALEHAFWHAEDNDALDEAVQTFLENHHNHPKTKHIRKRRHILRRQKRALIPALRPREIQLGPNRRWLKQFGGKYLGAESAIQFRNQVRLRIGIFGGNFEVNLDNYAKIDAYILKWSFNIVKGKAAFKASASFKNDIPKDLIHAIADAGDDILSKVDGITNIIIKHIEKFKEKLKNLVPLNLQKLINFVNKIVKFVENLLKPLKPINLMKKILALAKKVITRLKNWEWFMNTIRGIQITLNKLNIVDDVFKKVMGALNRIMSIINSIKLRLPHGLPPNFKIEDLLKWLKSVSIDLYDIKIKEFFKSLGLNFIPKGFNLQMPFRFSLHFSFSMDKFIEISMKVIKFANNFLDLSALLDALKNVRLPHLSLPRLEAKFPPLQQVKLFNFGLSFDWKVNLNFDLDLKSPTFLKFQNVLGKLGDFFKRFKLPSFNLEKFFEEIMPNKKLDLSKIFQELFGKNGNSTAVGRSPADVLQDFFDKVLDLIDSAMPNITAISDITDFFQELGPAMKGFVKKSVKKLCLVYKIALNSSRDFKTFGENIEKQGVAILKRVDNTTQSALQELVQYTLMIDSLIDNIEKNFTLASRGFVSKSLAELSKSLQEIQSLVDKVVKFANGTSAKADGVCNKAADFSANVIDDVQNVSRQALSELTGFIGPVAQKIKGIGQDLKMAVNNIESWYKENMEVRVGKISKIARLIADFMSILNTKKGFLGKVHEIAVKVNDILTHMKNIPAYAQKAREAADDIMKFADRAQTFKDEIQKLDIRKEFHIDYDKKVREFCDKFKKMATETLNKIGDYDIVDEVNEFFTVEAEKLITKAGSKLRRIKQPIEEIRTGLKEISVMVNHVIDVLINLKPFTNNFSPILATIKKLPDCQQADKILTESIKPCVQKAMIVGKYVIDQYKDMRREVKILYDMIPETWRSLKIQKCIKGGACISKTFTEQAKNLQDKVEKIKNSYKEASGYTDMLGTCRAGLENITQIIDTVKLLIEQVKDFNLKDDIKKVKDMLRSITGRNLAQPNTNSPVRSKRGIKDAKDKIKRFMDYIEKAKETKRKLEEILQNTFKAMKSVYDNAIFEHMQKIEDVSKKVNASYELWKKTKDINAILQGLDNIIKESSDYATKMTAITNGFSSPVIKLLTGTGELSDIIEPYMTKYIVKVKEATDKINGFFNKVAEFQNRIQLRQRGLDLTQYKKWSEYPFCSADVCLRPLRRSSSLYYSTIFTWKFPHLDDLSSMKDTGRWLIPGLFDDYKVEGITQLSNSEILLGMHGVSSNEGKASLLVVTDLGRNLVKKIIQLGSPQSPLTVAIGGVTVAKDIIWISDGKSNKVYGISKGSVTGSMGSAAPTWIRISKSYSLEGIGTSVSFDDQDRMLWITDGNAGKGYGYRLTPSGDLLTGKLAPDKVLVIGKDAQGMAIVRQFGTEYVVVSRCVWRAGYQCKLEFHDLTGGNEVSENSLSRVVRTPTGLESVDKVRNDLLVVVFSSGTYSEKEKVESIGGDFEDRYFRMKLPILKMTFGISENCLLFRVMGEWIISPRKLFPLGELRCGALRKRSIHNELLESDVYSQELEEVHSRAKRSSGEVPSCMTLFRGNVRRGYRQFMPDWEQIIIVFGIPVKLFAGAGGYWFVDYHGKVCMRDRTFKIGLIPGAWISVHAGASVSLWIVEAGITIEAILLETYLLPELTVKIDKWPLKACIELKMRMTPLKIRVWLWYRFRLCIKIRCKCFSCSIKIRWCSKKTLAEWWWSARQIERTLFTTCKEDIDRTPPVAGTCTAKQVGDKAYFVQWHGFKEDTTINHYWVKIGSISGSGDDYGANVGTSLSALVKNLHIMDERNVFASVRATNDGGLDSRLALCPVFKAKRIGPQIRFVNDGSQIGVDKDFQSDDYGMGLNFAWSNANQKIVDVKWGISTTSKCTYDEKEVDVYGLAPVGETTSIQTSGLSLKHGIKYYTRIIATNSVGLRTVMCSDGITIDTTPPVAGLFYDGAGKKDADYMPSTKRVRATFEPFRDGESPMVKYEWKVVQNIDLKPVDITQFVNILLSQRTPLMEDLDLDLGKKYNLILRGTNGAGLQAITQSNGFAVDNTGPTCNPVLDVVSINDSSDVDFVRQLKSIRAKWNCMDNESGVTKQLIAVGTYPGGDDVKHFENIENTTIVQLEDGNFVSFDNLEIKPKIRYHVTIKAYNGAGLRRTVTSDGILIDTTPPSVAVQYIKDGFQGKDVNYTKERFSFSAHWEQAFVDAESGLAEFRVGIGSVPGATDVKPLATIGKQTKVSLTGLILDSGQKYYVIVVGCNGVQMCVNASSNGAIVDFERPHPGAVITGYTGPPVLFQWITKSVWARWNWCPEDRNRQSGLINPSKCPKNTFYDTHSGINSFGLSVRSLANGKLLDTFTEVGKVQMSGRSIDLIDGVYAIAVNAIDKAGMTANGFSNSFIVDSSPVEIISLQHGRQGMSIRYTKDHEYQFQAYFELEDDLSRVFGFKVYVGSYPGSDDVFTSQNIKLLEPSYNIAVNWTADRSSKLENNRKYFVTVLAFNGAGLVGSGSSEALFSDTEPPKHATVLDGWGMEDVKYQSFPSMYRAHWYGISDFSGVDSVYLGLKSSLDKLACDIKGYELVPNKANYHVLYGLNLTSGSKYFACLKVVDNAQNVAYFSSNGVIVDSTPPVPGQVVDGISDVDIDFQTDSSILWASWRNFKEFETHIVRYMLAFGTSPGKEDIQEFTNVGLVQNAASTRLKVSKLTSGQRYYATVIALNNVGMQSTPMSSNGVTVDATPPTFNTRVTHGSGNGNIDKYTSNQSLAVYWKCADSETGLQSVAVAFGLQPGSNDVMNLTILSIHQTNYTLQATLKLGIRYFATVVCMNSVGLKSISSSAGVIYDNTPPQGRGVSDGDYQNSTTMIAIHWKFHDIESGMNKYQVYLHNPDKTINQGPYDFSAVINSGVIALKIPLGVGKRYYTNVIGYNGVGMVSSLLSDGFIVDNTPPACEKVWHGNRDIQRFIGMTSTLVISWKCAENESKITQIRFAVQEISSQQFILPFHSKKEKLNATGTTSLTGNGKWLPKYREGKRYRVAIELTNAIHLKVIYWTNGVLVDSTPPIVKNLKLSFNPSSDSIDASWKLKDEQSGIASLQWGLGERPEKPDIASPKEINKATVGLRLTKSQVQVRQGKTYFFFLFPTNNAGLSGKAVSNGIVIDRSPPKPGIVTAQYVLPQRYDRNKNIVPGSTITVSWTGFSDDESGIAAFGWSAGTTKENVQNLKDIHYTNIPVNQSIGGVQIYNFTLVGNTTYYVCIRATNGAGLKRTNCSDAMKVVLGNFSAGIVNDGPRKSKKDLDFQLDDRAIWAFWDGFKDPVFGVYDYEWCIGDHQPIPSAKEFCKWSYMKVNHLRKYAHRFYNITLSHGTKYYATVKAYNSRSESVHATSDGVVVDRSAPLGILVKVSPTSGKDTLYMSTPSAPTITWEMDDKESGMSYFTVAIGSYQNQNDLLNFTRISSLQRSEDLDDLNFSVSHGLSFSVTVVGYNMLGLKSLLSTQQVVIDLTPPTSGVVHDGNSTDQYGGLGLDTDYQTNTEVLSAHWSGFEDEESKVVEYKWCIGLRQGLCDVLPMTSSGLQPSAIAHLNLQQGARYFTTVEATNAAGLQVLSSSDGVTVDSSPPIIGNITFTQPSVDTTLKMINDLTIQSSGRSFKVEWTKPYDDQSGISSLMYCIGKNRSTCDVKGWATLDSGASSLLENFETPLPPGTLIYILLLVKNGAGLSVMKESSGLLLDWSPPTIGSVSVENVPGVKYLQADEGVVADWGGFKDLESGLDRYEWAICQAVNQDECLMQFIDVGLSTKLQNNKLDLQPGISYVLRIKAFNKIGLHSSAISNIFVPDNSKPTPGDVFDGNESGSDQEVQTSTTTFSANWEPFKDSNSRIEKYEMCIGNKPSLCDVSSFQIVDSVNLVGEITGLSLVHMKTYYATIRATNEAGYSALASSNGVAIDKTSPDGESVRDGNDIRDIDFQASGSYITANWDSFTDEETGIAKYIWCAGTTQGSCDVVGNREIVDSSTKVQTQIEPPIVSGVTVFVKVTAVNGAGGETTIYSDGVKIDSSPPVLNKVKDLEVNGSSLDIDFLTSKTKYCASWDATDKESGIKNSEISICEHINPKSCLARSIDVGNRSLICMSNLAFRPGVKYITTIRLKNNVGLSTSMDSDGFTLDFTPPISGDVNIGNPSSDLGNSSSEFTNSRIKARWSRFWDKESTILKYYICLGNYSGSCETKDWEDVGLRKEYVFENIELQHDTTYYVSVLAENQAGLKGIVESSKGIYVDKTAPIAGSPAYDGSKEGSDINFQLSDYDISANWKPFEDLESDVVRVEFCVGTTPGYCDVLSLRALSPKQHKIHEVLNQPVRNGQRLYFKVQATNGAGLTTAVTSDGVTIDNTPPIAGQVFDGNSSKDIDFLSEGDDVFVRWMNFKDDQSSIESYEVAICDATNLNECPQNFTNVNNDTRIKITGLDLQSGTMYIAKVKAINKAGLKTEVSSNGFTVDSTPPTADVAWIGTSFERNAQYQGNATALQVGWVPFIDAESGIVNYEICVQSSTSSAECTPYRSVGIVFNYELTGLNLQHSESYFVNIRATNGIGMTASTRTKQVLIDNTAPRLINQAPSSHLTFSCTEELVVANWDEFEDPESHVDRYEWCVGTASGKCDVTGKKSVKLKLIGREIVKRISSGSRLFATVSVFNKAGLKSVLMSKQCLVITVAPKLSLVSDLEHPNSSDTDIDWSSNMKTLTLKWETIGKFLNDISQMQIEVAVTHASQNITFPRLEPEKSWKGERLAQDFMAVHPDQRNVTIETIPMEPWEEYRSVVRVWNEGGVYTEKSSDGLRIEPSPPQLRQVDLRDRAVENEKARWLPNIHLPSFNLSGLDPDVMYVSSPDDILIAVSDVLNGTNSSLNNLNKILDSGAFSPTKEFKLLVNRVTSDSNETNTTQQSLETKTLPGFADPSGPCCTNHTPYWLVMRSDIHYKPTTTAKMFGSNIVQLPHDFVAVSSLHSVFIFSKTNRLISTKVISVGDQRKIYSLSYSQNRLVVTCNLRIISIYRLLFEGSGEITVNLEASLSKSVWPDLTANSVAIEKNTFVSSGKSSSLNTSVAGVFKKNNGTWQLFKVLRGSKNDLDFGSSLALNERILAVLTGNDSVIIYSTSDYLPVIEIDLKSYNIPEPSLKLTKDNVMVIVSTKSKGKVVVVKINTSLKSWKTVCSYDAPNDISLSGRFDLMDRDGGTVVVLGMQTQRGRDGVILTGFHGDYVYHPFHQKGKCIGLGRIIAREDVQRVDDGTPRASVSAKGSTILFGTPGVMTWPDGSERDGTGRVYSFVHCPRNSKRIKTSNIEGQEAFQCEVCEIDRKSLGAITRICEICNDRKCASALDDDPVHFVTKICNNTQCPVAKRFDNKTNAIKIEQDNGTFFQEGAVNEYTVELVEITRANMSTTSKSKTFIIDTTSPSIGTVYDGLGSDPKTNCSKNETFGEDSQCSTRKFQDTDIDYTNITTEVHARWVDFADNESDIAEYFFCVGSKPMVDDIRQCQSTGLRQNASEFGFDFKQGDTYYVTIVACNGARRCSAGHSNGVTIDTTPPEMLYVRDGVLGPDIDYQVFVDIIFAYFKGSDPDSGVTSYEVAWGTAPGLVDTKDFEEIGDATTWFANFKDNALKKKVKYYATVRATNKAGLLSDRLSSDGVLVGKSEYIFDKNASASFFFDTVNINPDGTRKDGGVGKTYGTLDVPKGAVNDEVKLTCYSLDKKTLESNKSDDGPVSNPTLTKPKQFMLGNYSFQIKAFDPKNNTIREGYKFAKPIKISMFYDVDNLVNANKRVVNKELKKDDVDPILYLWDVKNKTWIDAALTCPEPWSHVNRSIKLLTVQICHLTQFSFYWTFKAQKGLMMFEKNSSVYDSSGDINIARQSSVQEIELPVKRSKGSSGSIEVYWSLYSNQSNYREVMWPESGKLSFQEGQWNASLSVVVTSDKVKTGERTILVRLTNVSGGAILASHDLTTAKFVISSNLVAVPKASSSEWIIIGPCLGVVLILLILLIIYAVKLRKKKTKEKRVQKSFAQRSIRYTVNKKDAEHRDENDDAMEMTDTFSQPMMSTENNAQVPSFTYDDTPDISDDDREEPVSSKQSILGKFKKKSPKITSGIANLAAFDSASNTSTSDDEQLKEKKPKTKLSLKKKLSLGKAREPSRDVPREFENPAYGSFFDIRADVNPPLINIENGDDDVDDRNVDVNNGSSSPVNDDNAFVKPNETSIKRLNAWEPSPTGSTEDLVNSDDSVVSQEANIQALKDFGGVEPELEISSAKTFRPTMHESFNSCLSGSSDEPEK